MPSGVESEGDWREHIASLPTAEMPTPDAELTVAAASLETLEAELRAQATLDAADDEGHDDSATALEGFAPVDSLSAEGAEEALDALSRQMEERWEAESRGDASGASESASETDAGVARPSIEEGRDAAVVAAVLEEVARRIREREIVVECGASLSESSVLRAVLRVLESANGEQEAGEAQDRDRQ